jgi:cytidyltransferase-like protein
MANAARKVLVSGSYDLLHGGHVVFFETAAQYGQLYVCVGTDANILALKGKPTRFTEAERLYMVASCRFVHEARLSSGGGMLDFEPDLREIKPDFFVVNEDGHTDGKQALCESLGVEYIVLPRVPKPGLPPRSSSGLKKAIAEDARAEKQKAETVPPYRICLAGGWMDQPFVSKFAPGSCIVFQIEPDRIFNDRSGMATSTRKHWQKIYHHKLFEEDPIELARLLFGWENPPGTRYVSGSQDAIGLTLPGINRLWYDGGYWPTRIDSCLDEDTIRWLERSLKLVELYERPTGYDPLLDQRMNRENVARLGDAGTRCWEAILARDIRALGKSLTDTHNAWAEILPLTTNDAINRELDSYDRRAHGRITSGCGGGYIILATDEEIPGGFGVRIRR